MESVIAAIKARIEECKAKGKMFTMPKIEDCTVEKRKRPTSGSTLVHTEFVLRLSDGSSIQVDYQSKVSQPTRGATTPPWVRSCDPEGRAIKP